MGSAFIDPITCTWVCLLVVCGTYYNLTYIFVSPACLWKVMVRVPVGCPYLFKWIDCFAWYNIYIKLFSQDLFCWFLTCVYIVYLIGVHWYINFSLGAFDIFVGRIKIGHTYLLSPQVFGRSWQEWWLCDLTCHNQLIDWIQVNHPKLSLLVVIFVGFIIERIWRLPRHFYL